ncbi:MAG: HlyD family efflux transporter periplasmic adaptor subunit [Desulfuromonadaceae bacterium]|nr:HlyD family efflux transporter periplasmic adaptor subunit [Desulfuromonadaceae bacterium]
MTRPSSQTTSSALSWWRNYRLVGVALLLLLAGMTLWLWPRFEERAPHGQRVSVAVKRGDLTINVLTDGTIKPSDQVVISNTMEGRTTILSLVKEGTMVQQGDLLIELDASALEDRLVEQQIRVQNDAADYVQARENLEVVKNQAASDVEQAQLALEFSHVDLEKYEKGEYPAAVDEARARIAVSQEELRRAEERHSWSEVLFEEKFLSQTELQADALAAQKARLDLDLSRGRLELLREYDYPRRIKELRAEVKRTSMALERIKRKAGANVVQAEASLMAREAVLEQSRTRLEKIKTEISKTQIRAPQEGMVVYATSTKANWRGNVEPLDTGQEVRERQELIYLPSSKAKAVETKIHESDLQQVRVGQQAIVRVDALPQEIFSGRVINIGVLPDATSAWLNPDLKLFSVDISLEHEHEQLRSGMNCAVEIIHSELEDVLFVPLQAVVLEQGHPYVYTAGSDGAPVRVPVQIGAANAHHVQILAGVEEQERVLLNPPLAQGR